MDVFRVRLNCIDNYQATPSIFEPQLRNDIEDSKLRNLPKVPIIRVFGATPTGQKVCAHIHGAFPYLYIDYKGGLLPDDISKYIQKCHDGIDNALSLSYRREAQSPNSKFVARITIVKGIPFYGFHVGYMFFLKIYMLDPIVMTRLSDILRQGAVMNNAFQVYEAHLPYILQWMTDYNIYGSSYINCRNVLFRSPIPRLRELDNQSHLWHDYSIPQDRIIEENKVQKTSHCSIEVDICVQDILNRQDVKPRNLHHNFIERLSSSAPLEKLVHSMAELWRDETRRRKQTISDPDPKSSPFPPEVLISMSADHRYSQAGGWVHEEDYREKMANIIIEEKINSDGTKVTFENFVQPTSFESSVRTVPEAVGDLYPENLRSALGLSPLNSLNHTYGEKKEVRLSEIPALFYSEDFDNTSSSRSDYDTVPKIATPQHFEEVKKNELLEINSHESLDEPTPSKFKSENISFRNSDSKSTKSFTTLSPVIAQVDACGVNMKPIKNLDVYIHSKQPEDFITSTGLDYEDSINLKRKRSESPSTNCLKRKCMLSGRTVKENELDISVHDSRTKNFVKSIIPTIQPNVNSVVNNRVKTGSRTRNFLKSHKYIKSSVSDKLQERQIHFPVIKTPYRSRNTNKSSDHKSDTKLNLIENVDRASLKSQSLFSYKSSSPHPHMNLFCSNLPITSDLLHLLMKVITQEASERNLSQKFLILKNLPPSKLNVISTTQKFNIEPCIYQEAFYSNELDVPERGREWAGRQFKLESLSVNFLPEFDPTRVFDSAFSKKRETIFPDRMKIDSLYCNWRHTCGLRSWSIAEPPPTLKEVNDWFSKKNMARLKNEGQHKSTDNRFGTPRIKQKLPQIEGPTQKNKYGFKFSQDEKAANVKREALHMSIMSLEVHVNSRGGFVPDPEKDEVKCLFWCLQSDEKCRSNEDISNNLVSGVIVLSEDRKLYQQICKQFAVEVEAEASELDLMIRMVEIVRTNDPDILTGYEVQNSSWGYLIERARVKYDYNLTDEFSRIKNQSPNKSLNNDKWGHKNTSSIRMTGRHMINIWRIMRSELNLLQYTIENVVFHLLHRRIPHYSWADLTRWFSDNNARSLGKIVDYYLSRVKLNLEILERNEFIERTSEQARLLGVDFYSVISRGSQYKVESLMFRIAKPESFLLISPSRKQVGGQNALECLPLVMEPQSAYYTSPILVLDFQSLYPSVMIAYNYCYSTFLGRIVNWRGVNKMGFTEYKRQQRLLELLQDHINISPNGMMYTKPQIRKSLLAKMLGEILETRIMVKSGMKIDKADKALQRLLNNRQLALKLISNVTYGYTSASFSGRMPCSEIADSIVQTGRETLEKAITFIHSVKKWKAEVVYGDTDSLFIHLKGRTKDQAFDIGEEIARTITNINPRPIKLKFEKVYLPCVLIAKKRYVGFKYEHRNQLEPEFDAKGIETVRRDGTPAEQKIEERALKILFRTSDLSQVKTYFQSQCEKIMKGSVSIQDFCFTKEVRLGTYSEKGQVPPAALVSTKRMKEDARTEPQYGERVPYVVITGAPGARLSDRCVSPEELLKNSHNQLDSEYYISKNLIPPLERIFNLVGANVRSWYDEMTKFQRIRRVNQSENQIREFSNNKTMESYMKSSSCLVCNEKLETKGSICPQCLTDIPRSLFKLRQRINTAETEFVDIQKTCQSCSGISPLEEVRCISRDCPVFYTRMRQKTHLESEKFLIEPLEKDFAGWILSEKNLDW